jgi:hypothetical protein
LDCIEDPDQRLKFETQLPGKIDMKIEPKGGHGLECIEDPGQKLMWKTRVGGGGMEFGSLGSPESLRGYGIGDNKVVFESCIGTEEGGGSRGGSGKAGGGDVMGESYPYSPERAQAEFQAQFGEFSNINSDQHVAFQSVMPGPGTYLGTEYQQQPQHAGLSNIRSDQHIAFQSVMPGSGQHQLQPQHGGLSNISAG